LPAGARNGGADAESGEVGQLSPRHIAFVLPLILVHLGCGFVFLVGTSAPALVMFFVSSTVQVIGITLGYHRLLAHHSFKTGRVLQFVLAIFGVLAGQNGPFWWVGHHRHHHRHADKEGDTHSPRGNFFWGHMGWLFSPSCIAVRRRLVADLARFPELVRLERYSYFFNVAYAVLLYGIGEAWRAVDPAAGASGWQFVVWGGIVSTVWVYHAIWSANSVCHRFGFRRYPTPDQSRNNFIVSLLILGDGWHHNHHYCPTSARHGFRWWELDINFLILRLLRVFGLVWDLRGIPGGAAAYRDRLAGEPTAMPQSGPEQLLAGASGLAGDPNSDWRSAAAYR
jgi:stearoyl-CoA desaturase (delta-9 desaturase)